MKLILILTALAMFAACPCIAWWALTTFAP